MNTPKTTDFGFTEVPLAEKTPRVQAVFDRVASRYDLMNDLMSLGLHRLWKQAAAFCCHIKQGAQVLDLAGGTGDMARLLLPKVGDTGRVVVCDLNPSMLTIARDRLLDEGYIHNTDFIVGDAENLPFPKDSFDAVMMAFGLRNVTDKLTALKSMYRTLKPGGAVYILEFSKITPMLQPLYDAYSLKLLPTLGQWVAGNADSYRYLAESIRRHPNQQGLLELLQTAGFEDCSYFNGSFGVVALHRGWKY